MTELERLCEKMTDREVKAARLGYGLGLLHGADVSKAPEIDLVNGPEMRILEDMDLG